ncbi:MAG: hypothetical protein ACI8RD_005843 [Bacillariaceae sp.]|jgi:hypothetical protein
MRPEGLLVILFEACLKILGYVLWICDYDLCGEILSSREKWRSRLSCVNENFAVHHYTKKIFEEERKEKSEE